MVRKNPKYSKRINYDALAGLLSTPLPGQSPAPDDNYGEKHDDGLLRFDDKDGEDEEGIVEEDARYDAAATVRPPRARTEEVGKEMVALAPDEEEEEDVDEGKDDYDANAQWEDAFEQEAF
jgi:transcription factor IIIB subunit 2